MPTTIDHQITFTWPGAYNSCWQLYRRSTSIHDELDWRDTTLAVGDERTLDIAYLTLLNLLLMYRIFT